MCTHFWYMYVCWPNWVVVHSAPPPAVRIAPERQRDAVATTVGIMPPTCRTCNASGCQRKRCTHSPNDLVRRLATHSGFFRFCILDGVVVVVFFSRDRCASCRSECSASCGNTLHALLEFMGRCWRRQRDANGWHCNGIYLGIGFDGVDQRNACSGRATNLKLIYKFIIIAIIIIRVTVIN